MEKFKNILIGVLFLVLIGIIVFGPKYIDDGYGEEIAKLKSINESLIIENDSIKNLNIKINERIEKLDAIIKVKTDSLEITNEKIKKLQDGKDKVSPFVDNLDIDGVDRALTEYLENRQN